MNSAIPFPSSSRLALPSPGPELSTPFVLPEDGAAPNFANLRTAVEEVLLMDNLDSLSALAGFDPNNPTDTWHAHPTHTLRFAEILAKIYASEFGVGELLFLFTNDEHLQGDDPFPLQPANEAKDSPLSLPDDGEQNSLWMLRQKLMAVVVNAESAQQWTWTRMETTLRDEFGFSLPPVNNHWLSLGQHFFPSVLADSGIAVSTAQRQYRVSLPQPTPILIRSNAFGYLATATQWRRICCAVRANRNGNFGGILRFFSNLTLARITRRCGCFRHGRKRLECADSHYPAVNELHLLTRANALCGYS